MGLFSSVLRRLLFRDLRRLLFGFFFGSFGSGRTGIFGNIFSRINTGGCLFIGNTDIRFAVPAEAQKIGARIGIKRHIHQAVFGPVYTQHLFGGLVQKHQADLHTAGEDVKLPGRFDRQAQQDGHVPCRRENLIAPVHIEIVFFRNGQGRRLFL